MRAPSLALRCQHASAAEGPQRQEEANTGRRGAMLQYACQHQIEHDRTLVLDPESADDVASGASCLSV